MNIEKWFTFITYADLTLPNEGAFNGMSLFTDPEPGAGLTSVGELLKDRAAPFL